MTTDQVHGHDVMEMMLTAKLPYTKATLKAAIIDKFGADARFYTCSAERMTADELIEFLAQRGKFTAGVGGFVVDPSAICQH